MEEAKEVIDLRRWYRGNGRCDSEAGAVVEGGRERERDGTARWLLRDRVPPPSPSSANANLTRQRSKADRMRPQNNDTHSRLGLGWGRRHHDRGELLPFPKKAYVVTP